MTQLTLESVGVKPEPETDECAHENTIKFSKPSPRLQPDGHPWAGKHPIFCLDCRDVVDRVE